MLNDLKKYHDNENIYQISLNLIEMALLKDNLQRRRKIIVYNLDIKGLCFLALSKSLISIIYMLFTEMWL